MVSSAAIARYNPVGSSRPRRQLFCDMPLSLGNKLAGEVMTHSGRLVQPEETRDTPPLNPELRRKCLKSDEFTR